jgi:hypothetical protein
METNYNIRRDRPSDINQHMEILKNYAQQCESVLELGVRGVVSSWAFAYGLTLNESQNKLLFCNDLVPCDLSLLQSECNLNKVELQSEWCSDLQLEIPDYSFDLVFIDTFHVYGQLRRELQKFSKVARKYIIMHDTTVDAEHGEARRLGLNVRQLSKDTGLPEDEIERGLAPALDEFLKGSEWRVREVFTNNNGLTVLERNY